MIKNITLFVVIMFSLTAKAWIKHKTIDEIEIYEKITTLDHQEFFQELMLAMFKTTPEETITVNLNNIGGNLLSALEMHRYITDAINNGVYIVTKVEDDALCLSACTIVFAAGKERLAGPNAKFGFHGTRVRTKTNSMFFVSQEELDEANELYKSILNKLSTKLVDFLVYAKVFEDKDSEIVLEGKTMYEKFPVYVTGLLEE